jgi:hypothetical protein
MSLTSWSYPIIILRLVIMRFNTGSLGLLAITFALHSTIFALPTNTPQALEPPTTNSDPKEPENHIQALKPQPLVRSSANT